MRWRAPLAATSCLLARLMAAWRQGDDAAVAGAHRPVPGQPRDRRAARRDGADGLFPGPPCWWICWPLPACPAGWRASGPSRNLPSPVWAAVAVAWEIEPRRPSPVAWAGSRIG